VVVGSYICEAIYGDSVSRDLWQPTASIELAAFELMELLDAHLLCTRNAVTSGQAELRQFHESSAIELCQRAASVAPHVLTPDGITIA
jgi:hypothetical protein